MRVTTAFNRMLGLPGAWVRDVEFGAKAMIVTVWLRRKQPVCSGCGARGLPIKDHRVKRWRHLDAGGLRCVIECRLRRLYCPGCGELPSTWSGREAARGTPATSTICRLAGAADEPDAGHAADADRLGDGREHPRAGRRREARRRRLDGLELIGVDEVNYGADHKFLTCVANHERRGRVGDGGPQRRQLASVLRRAHGRAEGLDPGGLDRHVRRL